MSKALRDDSPAAAAVFAAQQRMRHWRHSPRESLLIVNEKVDVAWDLLIDTRRVVRAAHRRAAPLKTGRYAR